MTRVRLGLAQAIQLLLGLLLEVLEDIDDAAAVRLVGSRGRRTEVLVVGLGIVARLHQRRQALLVRGGERRRIDHRADGLDDRVQILALDLREGRRILAHLPLDDADRPADGVDGLHELGFARLEVSELLLSDLGRALQVRLIGGDACGQLLDLAGCRLDVAGGLADCRGELLLVRGSCLHLVLLVPGGIVAPLGELLVSLLLHLAFGLDLCLQLAKQADHRAEGVGRRTVARHRGEEQGCSAPGHD
mmetsp:Transcript_75336/g.218815  ORF Transcript_75336/g.218815 Transcript_75336/m.218815 type:complete len:247 (-) Transcript_75336:49-789(-)